MSIFSNLVLGVFILWFITYIWRTIFLWKNNAFWDSPITYIWIMAFGMGFGLLIYNYEIEQVLATRFPTWLPFTPSTLRIVNGLMLITFTYYWGILKKTILDVPRWIFVLLIAVALFGIALDIVLARYLRLPYERHQIIMTLLITPTANISALGLRKTMKTILSVEVKEINRAHYYLFIAEIYLAFGTSTLFLIDAIIKLLTADYRILSPLVFMGQCGLFLLLGINSLRLSHDKFVRWLLYPEKLRLYLRLRALSDHLHKLTQTKPIFLYQQWWVPSLNGIEHEIYRQFITIFDVARLLEQQDFELFRNFQQLRENALSYHETLKMLEHIHIERTLHE